MQERLNALGYGDKSHHIYYGWGCQNWKEEHAHFPKHTDFLFVGRMMPEKGILELLDAFKKVLQVKPNSTLRVVGEGPIRRQLLESAQAFGIADNVDAPGAVPWTEIHRYFQSSKCTIVPSLNEPFGYVALEAIMYGSLPLVSNACGLKEIATYVPFDCKIDVQVAMPHIFMPHPDDMAEKMLRALAFSDKEASEISHVAQSKVMSEHNFLTTSLKWAQLIVTTSQ